ncbi:hypothetical protein VTL71DRAFT_12749 [Oculimacula yallundae]|uniref:Uncharacterized protein n=1 Tax=Oculimacula yallundae TaxID=86028 RepID=A0ABR4CNE7_9HELO
MLDAAMLSWPHQHDLLNFSQFDIGTSDMQLSICTLSIVLLAVLLQDHSCLSFAPDTSSLLHYSFPPGITKSRSVTDSRPSTNLTVSRLSARGNAECPEIFGIEPMGCMACGGENLANLGHCLGFNLGGIQCQCTISSVSANPPIMATVTATQVDVTVVGTYVLETLTSYSNLRQSFTTTLVVTETGTGAVKTAAAVIMAGGAAWFLAGFAGDAGVGEKILEPPKDGDRNPDDKTCPSPRQSCSSCGAIGQICAVGTSAGCVCDESTADCPSGADKPKCSDVNCAPDANNKCTKDHPGCDCEPKEECPGDVDDVIMCHNCGGEINGCCKGDPKDNYRFKDCPCLPSTPKITMTCDYVPYRNPENPQPEIDELRAMWAAVKDWSDNSTYTKDPNNDVPDAECQKAGWAAPQRDLDGSPSIDSSATAWCTEMDGKTVTKQPTGTDTLFKITISKDECMEALNAAMISCDPNSGVTHGASLTGSCIKYKITLGPDTNPQSPPWNPATAVAPQCDLNMMSGIHYSFFEGIYPAFCSLLDASDRSQPFSHELTNVDFKTPSKRSLGARTPPADANHGASEGVKFQFRWSGGTGDCRKGCKEAFSDIVKLKCGSSGSGSNGMTSEASLNVGCGTYAYTIEKPPVEPPLKDTTCNGTSQGYYVSYSSISANSVDFCSKISALGNVEGGVIHTETYNDKTPDKVEFIAAFSGNANSLSAQVNIDDCNGAMKNLIDNCDVPLNGNNARNYKNGGSFSLNSAVYSIRPTKHRRPSRPNNAESSCWMWYKGLWNTFDVEGYGFADADSGGKLLHHIRSCGAVTEWKFKYYESGISGSSNWKGYEWKASGRLPIGQQMWACIGKAIESASDGGTGSGGCSGQ